MLSRYLCYTLMQPRVSTWYRLIRFLSPTRSAVKSPRVPRSSVSFAVASLAILVVFSMAGMGFAQEAKTAFPTVEFDIPAEHTSTVGTPVTIDAVFYNDGEPVSGISMIFEVIEGPNKGLQEMVETDRNGHATFTYTSERAGRDTVEYGWECPTTGKRWRWATITVTWIAKPEATPGCAVPVEAIVPGSTRARGPRPGTTFETGDPIFAGGGEFRRSWTLLSLGGPIPLDFTLIYGPDLRWKTPTNDGRTQFPPWNSIASFTSNTVIRIVEFEDRTASPARAYVNVFMSDDTIVFADDSRGKFVAQGPIGYQLERIRTYYYLMDPIRELVYIFRSRELGCGVEEGGRVSQHTTRVGEVVYILDRNTNRLSYTYNHDNLPIRIEDALGRVLELTYRDSPNLEGRHLIAVSDGRGRTATFQYTPMQCRNGSEEVLASFTDVMGQTTSFEYESPAADAEGMGSIADILGQATSSDSDSAATNDCDLLRRIVLPLGNSHVDQTWKTNPHGVDGIASQKDALGNETSFSWEEAPDGNLITTVEHPDGSRRIFHHERERYPLDLTDEAGNRFFMTYNEDSQMTSVTDRMGDTTEIAYHRETGLIASVTNNAGATLVYSYTAKDQTFANPATGDAITFTFYDLTCADYADGSSVYFAYDGRGNATEWADQTGETWQYQYNDRGQITAMIDPAGGVTRYTYNVDATLASNTDADGNTIVHQYDEHRRPIGVTYPDGRSIGLTYDLLDRTVAIVDAAGKRISFQYDANGNLIRAIDPSGMEIRYSYDATDRLVKVIDRSGAETRFAYDELGRLAAVTDPTGIVTRTGYDSRGWMSAFSIGEHRWDYEHDDEGLLVASSAPSGHTVTLQRDVLGHLAGMTTPLAEAYVYERDALSRLRQVTDPLGRTTAYAYDPRGLLAGVVLSDDVSSTYTWNSLGLLTEISDPNDEVWVLGYTPAGRLRSSTDPLGNTWHYAHDCCGRVAEVEFPDGINSTYTYGAVGNLLSVCYSDGTELQYGYDELDRPTSANGIELTRDEEGQVIDSEDSDSSFGATYDAAGRLETVTYANGAFTVTYAYDPATGVLVSASDDLTGAGVEFVYDDDLRPVEIVRSNGTVGRFTWDSVGRLTHIREGSFVDLQYTYNAAGELTEEVRALPFGDGTIAYAHDGAGRLIAAEYDSGDRMDYSYDAAGNLLERTGKAFLEGGWREDEFSYDAASQLHAFGYVYDPQGRLAKAPEQTFTWDAASRLVGLDDVELRYNGFGELISRSERGETTHYHYNYAIALAPIVAERDLASSQFLRYYVWTPSGELLYMIDATDGHRVGFYHFDRAGSTVAVTDASGSVTDSYSYAPYGGTIRHDGSSDQPFTFLGRWGVRKESRDGLLYHIRARYYDAVTGRFISRDPVWPRIGDPREINPYQYALSDPIGHLDRTGRIPCGIYALSSSEIRSRINDLEQEHSSLLEAYCNAKGEERAVESAFESFYNETADDRQALAGLRRVEDKLGQLAEIVGFFGKIGDLPLKIGNATLKEVGKEIGLEVLDVPGPGTIVTKPSELLAGYCANRAKNEADLIEVRLNSQENELFDQSVANFQTRSRYLSRMNEVEEEIQRLRDCLKLRQRQQILMQQCIPPLYQGEMITTPSVLGLREVFEKIGPR
jgi:RHS repeat-associated protein